MFVLSAQNTTLSSHVKKTSSPNLMASVGFQVSKIWMFFGKFAAKQVLKLFLGRNSSLKFPVVEFCDSLPFGLEESRE